jgi:hypothetical protein
LNIYIIHITFMSYDGIDEPGGWGSVASPPSTGDVIKDALKKEQVLKCALSPPV